MSIVVDTRAGSKELIAPLRKLGIGVIETILPHGDIYLATKPDEEGHSVDIGVEFKTIQEFVTSLRDGRLIKTQASGMLGPKGDFDVAWLLIEGEWAVNNEGLVITPKWRDKGGKRHWAVARGNMNASEMKKRLFTLMMKGGFHVWFSDSRKRSLEFLLDLYRWSTDKPWDAHQTLLSSRNSQVHGFIPISDFRAILKDHFPGIGLRASASVERHFRASLRDACNASASEWADIAVKTKVGSKRLGMAVAQRIQDFVSGGDYVAGDENCD